MDGVSIAIGLRGVAARDFRFAVSALAELSAALHLLAEPAHHPEQHAALAEIHTTMPREVMADLREVDYLFRTSRADMFLPASPARTLTAELDALDQLSDESWVSAALLTSSCGTIPVVHGMDSPLTDPAAREIARQRAAARGERPARFVEATLSAPGAMRARIRALFEACAAAFFAESWRHVEPILQRDARDKRALLDTVGPARALPSVSASIAVDEVARRLVIDKVQDESSGPHSDGPTFLPTVFGHPHVLVVHAPGWPAVVQYPCAAAPAGAVPGQREVQRRLHALDNEIRFRLARSLARGPRTTRELADLWDLPAPVVSRHLTVLKAAELVTTRRQGRYVVYALETATLANLGHDAIELFLR
jgi:DNA-binding transcriptional ArsR family regulator